MASTVQCLKPSIPTSPFFSPSSATHPLSLKTHPNVNTNKLFFFSSRIHSLQNTPPLLSGRLFLPSVSSIWDALTGGSNNNNAREAVAAIRNGFQKGAEQLRIDVAQNPNDTEESIWRFLCEAQLYGVDGARQRFLEVGRDCRPFLREAYSMFKDGGDPEKLVAEFSSGPVNEYFYASLYAELYYECQKEAEEAKLHILAACQSPYGQRSDDYMASLANVHCLCRGWNSS